MKTKVRVLETEEQSEVREVLSDNIYIRVSKSMAAALYNTAKKNRITMSEVARLCIEAKLAHVDQLIEEIQKVKRGMIEE